MYTLPKLRSCICLLADVNVFDEGYASSYELYADRNIFSLDRDSVSLCPVIADNANIRRRRHSHRALVPIRTVVSRMQVDACNYRICGASLWLNRCGGRSPRKMIGPRITNQGPASFDHRWACSSGTKHLYHGVSLRSRFHNGYFEYKKSM